MNVIAIVSAAGALTFLSMGVTRQAGLEGRLATMEEAASRSKGVDKDVSAVVEMQARLDALVESIAAQPSNVEAVEATAALRLQVATLRADLALAKKALTAQEQQLQAVDARTLETNETVVVEAIDDTRLDGIVEALEAQAVLTKETRDELDGVRARIESGTEVRDSGDAWFDMVAPTVQLAGDATVGSGVLLKSQLIEDTTDEYQTLLLTSWHVVRDIRADAVQEDAPIPVMLRDAQGVKRHFTATLVAFDVPLDACLLEVDSVERFDVGAKLPTRDSLQSARVFDPIVAVGCPLGNDPIPTKGHLSDLHHSVSAERFWMISAPTYIGNSGGGIYSGSDHALLGIFSKIYTHGAIRPTVIPHMGLVTPLEEFYDWIDGAQVAEVVESGGEATIVLR